MERDLEKLAKEFVLERLKSVADPYALAGDIARKIAVAGARSSSEPRAAVSAACRGVIGGMLILEKNLPKTAVALLAQMAVVAQEAHLDPGDCMTWAMEGIAPVCKLAPNDMGSEVRAALEAAFMGAGDIFERVLRTSGA